MKTSRINLTLIVLLTPLLLLFCYLAAHTFFADSEIWSISSSKLFPQDFETRGSFLQKPLFHAWLRLPYFLELTSSQTLLAARFQSLLIGLLVLAAVYRLAMLFFRSRSQALFTVFLTVTSTLFLSRGFRVRSDLIAVLFFLFSLSFVVQYLTGVRRSLPHVKCGVGIFAMFLVTPKAAIFWVLFIVFLIAVCSTAAGRQKSAVKKHLAVLGIPPLLFAGVFLAALLFSYKPVIFAYKNAYDFFMESVRSLPTVGFNYLSASDFLHLNYFIQRNPLFSLLAVFALVAGWKDTNPLRRGWQIMTVTAVTGMLLYPGKQPFFLVTFVPLLALSIAMAVDRMRTRFDRLLNPTIRHWIWVAATASILYSSLSFARVVMKYDSNRLQRKMINATEEYIQENQVQNYYDAIGSIARQDFIPGFIGHSQDYLNSFHVEQVEEIRPDLILYTAKLALLKEQLRPFLQEHYLHLGYEVWGRAESVAPTSLAGDEVIIEQMKYRRTPVEYWHERIRHWPLASALSLSTTYDLVEEVSAIKAVDQRGHVVGFPGSIPLEKLTADYTHILIPLDAPAVNLSRFPRMPPGLIWNFNALFQFDVPF